MTETLAAFVNRTGVKVSAEWADRNPNIDSDDWAGGATHWRCTLRKGRRSMLVFFSQGSAYTSEPEIQDVLDCLASDAAGYENAHNFEDWADEHGYDTDSCKAERTYRTIGQQAQALRRVLGADYEPLLWETERL